MHVRDVPTSVISKIAKLLRLAERKHGAEADVAAAMAEKLMDKWGIEVDAGVDLGDDVEHIVFHVSENCAPWRFALASGLGQLYGCTARTSKDTQAGEGEPKRNYLHLEGPANELLSMRLHYRYLECEIERMVATTYVKSERHVLATGAARYVVYLVETFLLPEKKQAQPPPPISKNMGGGEKLEAVFGQAEEISTALAKLPRTKVREASTGSQEPPLPDVDVDVSLPHHIQLKGANLASKTKSVASYATRMQASLDIPIASAAIGDKHVRSILRDINIRYVGELVELRRSQLVSVAGLGQTRVAMLEADLSYMGLHLRPENVFVEDDHA